MYLQNFWQSGVETLKKDKDWLHNTQRKFLKILQLIKVSPDDETPHIVEEK